MSFSWRRGGTHEPADDVPGCAQPCLERGDAKGPVRVLHGRWIAERGGSYKVTVGLLEEFGKKRVIDTPISEASFTGAGVARQSRA